MNTSLVTIPRPLAAEMLQEYIILSPYHPIKDDKPIRNAVLKLALDLAESHGEPQVERITLESVRSNACAGWRSRLDELLGHEYERGTRVYSVFGCEDFDRGEIDLVGIVIDCEDGNRMPVEGRKGEVLILVTDRPESGSARFEPYKASWVSPRALRPCLPNKTYRIGHAPYDKII